MGITSLRTQRPTPQNICGQSTDTNGMRYYPTRWIFVNVNFVEFQFYPRYPPHISVCCVAVQLKVDDVDEFSKHWEATQTAITPISTVQSAETPQKSNDTKTDSTDSYHSICGLVLVPQCLLLLSILLTVYVMC